MYELQLYVSRAYGMLCALLCIADVHLENTNLDMPTVRNILAKYLGKSTQDLQTIIDMKRSIITKIPQSVLDMKDPTPKVDVKALAQDGKANLVHVVVMCLLYMFTKDTLDHMEMCKQSWSSYASQPQMQASAAKFQAIFDDLIKLVAPFYEQVAPLALGLISNVQASKPALVEQICSVVLSHHSKLVEAYTSKFIVT